MRILFIYRHFWPDIPPYASMLRSIGAHLVEAGHDVSVWCEMPTYGLVAPVPPCRESLDGISISRIGSLPLVNSLRAVRALGMVLFPLRMFIRGVFRKLAGEDYDLVVTATIPPVINGFFALLTARLFGARFVYHCQDIYPELGAAIGLWKADAWLFRSLMWLDLRTCRRAGCVVVLGEDMRATLEARGLPRGALTIISNFMLQDFRPPMRQTAGGVNSFQVIFAGNMGRFQGLDAVMDAADALQGHGDIEFLFLGDGSEFDRLKRRCGALANVQFVRGMPIERARPVIAAASLGIVSLLPGLIRAAYPSKTLTYLGLGVPVLALVEQDCELARMIEGEGVGFVCRSLEGEIIAKAIRRAYDDRRSIGSVRRRAKALYAKRFSTGETLRRWEILVAETARPA